MEVGEGKNPTKKKTENLPNQYGLIAYMIYIFANSHMVDMQEIIRVLYLNAVVL